MSECQRCGLCCMDRGDIGGIDLDRDWGDCSALKFEGKIAICEIEKNWGHGMKPDACKQYPFPDIDGGKCQRELQECKRIR